MKRSTAISVVVLLSLVIGVVSFFLGHVHGKASVEPYDTSFDIAFHTQLMKELNAGRTNKVAHRLNCMLDLSTYNLAIWENRLFVRAGTRRAMDSALRDLAGYRLHYPRSHTNPFSVGTNAPPGMVPIPKIPSAFHTTVDQIIEEHQERLQQPPERDK